MSVSPIITITWGFDVTEVKIFDFLKKNDKPLN